jgi:hypothetical protein
MEDFGVDAGPVHNDGALVSPDLGHLSQLRVPLQWGQARSLHKRGVSQYDQSGIKRRSQVFQNGTQTIAPLPSVHVPRFHQVMLDLGQFTMSKNLLDRLGLRQAVATSSLNFKRAKSYLKTRRRRPLVS